MMGAWDSIASVNSEVNLETGPRQNQKIATGPGLSNVHHIFTGKYLLLAKETESFSKLFAEIGSSYYTPIPKFTCVTGDLIRNLYMMSLGFRFPQISPLSSPNLAPPFSKFRNHGLYICNSSSLETAKGEVKFTQEESRLIEALLGIQGRGRSASPRQLQDVERAVSTLENIKGVPAPTSSSLIEGSWQLTFTTRPGTASPIQRTFVGVDVFSVFQEVYLRTNDPRVSNIVKFSDAVGELKVEAVASIGDEKRICFRFDRAAFAFKFLPFKVPYPVPFRLLGDEAKGWLDTTYLSPSGNIRISRGNKGTTFILQKETEPRQRLLSVIATGNGVQKVIDEFISQKEDTENGDNSDLLEGEWKMIWSSQMETDSWLENAGNGLMGTQVIKKDGQMKFLVDILLGFKFSMTGKLLKSGEKIYDVKMDDAAIVFSSFGLPIEMESGFKMEILYSDGRLRITRGYNGIVFVHLRVDA